jgi:peptide/nickel transport system permease protein
MATYIVRRLIQAVFVIIIVSLLVFIVIRFLPGDPVLMYLSREEFTNLTMEEVEHVRHELGLDRSLLVQYFDWLSDLSRGNLGTSLFYQENVANLLAQRVPVTLHLGIWAFIISAIIGIGMGTISALRRGKAIDTLTTVLANIGITMPIFWLGILLIYLFGLQLQFLPIYGYTSPFTDFWLNTKQIILPVICLAFFPLASSARQTRSSMLEVIRQDYIRTAWAKGLR